MNRRCCATAVTLALAVLTGCSEQDTGPVVLHFDTTITATTTETVTTIAPTTASPTTPVVTTEPSATRGTVATTVTAETSSITTEPAPTTTLPLVDRVKADFLLGRELNLQCNFDPTNCVVSEYAVPGSEYEVHWQGEYDSSATRNIHGVPGKGSIQSTIENVTLDGDLAYLTFCAYDTYVIYAFGDPNTSEDDAIYDDERISRRVLWELRETDNRWRIVQGRTLDELSGGDLCGF